MFVKALLDSYDLGVDGLTKHKHNYDRSSAGVLSNAPLDEMTEGIE